MQPVTVTRADLAWALGAVLPHCGDAASGRDWVGIQALIGITDGLNLAVYATDGYTVGVARIENTGMPIPPFDIALQKREAQDLLRLVRPTLKRHDTQPVQLIFVPEGVDSPILENGPELHAGLPPSESESEGLSEVFEVMTPGASFQDVYGLVLKVKSASPDFTAQFGFPYYPDYAARFAKAARCETDRLTQFPRISGDRGATYITVGDRFEGAIAGMKPAQRPEEQEAA